MKRTPLTRKTPLRAKKSSSLKRGKLKPISKKRTGWLKKYAEHKQFLGNNQRCARCGKRISIGSNASWHHTSGRRTLETLLTIIPVCEIPCHKWIHENPGQALEAGLLTTEFFRSTKP